MKSHDIGIMLKLICLQQYGKEPFYKAEDWQDWDRDSENESKADKNIDYFSVRGLANETGVSKSQVSLSLHRMQEVGLVALERKSKYPVVNRKALYEFIFYGLKYVFPARPGELARGIGTAFNAPVMNGEVMSAGEFQLVWPDAKGKTKGQAIEPLFKSVTYAVKRDPQMYIFLALIDAIRVGQSRERNLAGELLKKKLEYTS